MQNFLHNLLILLSSGVFLLFGKLFFDFFELVFDHFALIFQILHLPGINMLLLIDELEFHV